MYFGCFGPENLWVVCLCLCVRVCVYVCVCLSASQQPFAKTTRLISTKVRQIDPIEVLLCLFAFLVKSIFDDVMAAMFVSFQTGLL